MVTSLSCLSVVILYIKSNYFYVLLLCYLYLTGGYLCCTDLLSSSSIVISYIIILCFSANNDVCIYKGWYLLGCLLTTTSGATRIVLSIWVVPEDLDESVVEERLTTSVCSAGLSMACK